MSQYNLPAISHSPLLTLVADENVALRIQACAEAGYGGLLLAADDVRHLQAVDAACAEQGLRWWLKIGLFEEGAALETQSFEVAAGGAAGAWQRARAEGDWFVARAVPLGEQGARGHETLDLLNPREAAALSNWNQRSRFFLFRHGAQASFWPDSETTREVLEQMQNATHALGASSALQGVWLQIGEANENANVPLFPYSDGIEEEFERATGRDFAAALPSLVADTGTLAVANRLAFWEAAFACAAREFWQPIRSACDAKELELVVGYRADRASALEARWGDLVRRYADRIEVRAASDESGDGRAQTECRVAVRQAASFAALDDRCLPLTQAMSDAAVLLAGAAQPVGAQNSTFITAINRQAARDEALMMWGQSGARTALLWPTRSLRAHYNPRAHRFVRWVEDDLQKTAHLLETLHFDFLLLPGSDLETARVEESRGGNNEQSTVDFDRTTLCCGRAGHRFDMIVLPSLTTLAHAAWDKLEAFVEAGGKVVCLGLLPRWSERGRDEEFEARIGRVTMQTVADIYAGYANLESGVAADEISGVGYPIARSNARGGRLSSYQPRLNEDAADARLRVRQLLMDSLAPTVESQNDALLVTRRVRGDDEIFLLHNRDERAARVHLRFPARRGKVALQWLDGLDASPASEWMTLNELEGGGLSLPLEMAGKESRALLVRNDDANALHVERANFVVEQVTENAASGYATQSGAPTASWLENERLVTRRGAEVRVPPPLLLEWEPDKGSFVARPLIPADWKDCRVWFEVAGNAPFQLFLDGREVGTRVMPPWKLEITPRAGETIELRIYAKSEEVFARLTAYPRVEISL